MPGPAKRGEGARRITLPLRGRRVGGEDGVWKRLTLLGNAAFVGGHWGDAELLYDRALAEAERLFAAAVGGERFRGCEPAPILVASTANAAENWLKLGNGQRAGEAVVQLRRILCDTIADDAAPFPFRQQCFIHLRMATIELLGILPRAGWAEAAIAQEAADAKAVGLRFIEIFVPKH